MPWRCYSGISHFFPSLRRGGVVTECAELGRFGQKGGSATVTFLHTPMLFYELCIFIDEKTVLTKS